MTIPGGGAVETGPFAPDARLRLCQGLSPSNAPPADADGYVMTYSPLVQAGPVALALNPAPGACLTSGFGPRRGRLHRGLDLQSQPPGPIVAAADGRVLEAGWRDDYGLYVVIEHGGGVYTLYAHLARMTERIAPGAPVRFGQVLGVMGGTASPPVPIHLHYEILLGDYRKPEGVFGLFPVDPFRFPPAQPPQEAP